MATIHELPSKESRGIPPELRDLTLAGLQEHMLGTIRESLFLAFAASPECVGITLRRQVAERFWDIKITCAYYQDEADPSDRFTRYFWDVCEADETITELAGDADYESPEDAYTAALAALPALVAQWAEEAEMKATTERFLLDDPEGEREVRAER